MIFIKTVGSNGSGVVVTIQALEDQTGALGTFFFFKRSHRNNQSKRRKKDSKSGTNKSAIST